MRIYFCTEVSILFKFSRLENCFLFWMGLNFHTLKKVSFSMIKIWKTAIYDTILQTLYNSNFNLDKNIFVNSIAHRNVCVLCPHSVLLEWYVYFWFCVLLLYAYELFFCKAFAIVEKWWKFLSFCKVNSS
jgi:hypothetical protein